MQKKQIHRISPIQRYQANKLQEGGESVFIVVTIYSLKCLVSNNKKCETAKKQKSMEKEWSI